MSSGFPRLSILCLLIFLGACERESRDFNGVHAFDADTAKHFEQDAYDVAQGKALFEKMNCVGCHGHGGGGMGPALIDNYWIYGGSLAQIYRSIRDGRPNGMPAWRNKLTNDQLWQVASYVRSMGRYVRKDVAPGRDDALQSGKAESRRQRSKPVTGKPPG